MEQRSWQRQAVDIAAVYTSAALKTQSCSIRDYCAGGLMIDSSTEYVELLSVGDPIVVAVSPQVGRSQACVELQGNIRRIAGTLIGMQFNTELDAATGNLFETEAERYRNSIAQAPWEKITGARRTSVISHVIDSIGDWWPAVSTTLLQSLDQILLAASGSASSNSEIEACFESINILKTQGRELCDQLLDDFRRLAREPENMSPTTLAVPAKLSLVGEGEFEEWLLISSVGTRIESSHTTLLSPISEGLSVVYGLPIGYDNNPVGPRTLARLFLRTFGDAFTSYEVRGIIFEEFEQTIRTALEDLLRPIRDKLQQAGINRVLKARAHALAQQGLSSRQQSNPASDTATGRDSHTFTQSQAEPGTDGAVPAADLKTLNNLLHTRDFQPDLKTIACGLYPVSMQDLLSDLDDLESQINEQQTMEYPLSDWVIERLEHDYPEPRSLTPEQRLPIDLTDSIFEHALSDKRLLPKVQASLQKLKVPLLKMMLKDPSVIDDRKHPARQLVNQLVRLSCSRGPGSGSMRKSIDDAVEQIVQQEASGSAEIEEVLEQINHLVAMQNNAFLRNMQLVQVTRQGQEKLRNARYRVEKELASLTQGQPVPALFKHLVENGWRKLLVLTLLKQGENSPEWKDYTTMPGQLLELLRARENDGAPVVTKEYLSKVKAVTEVLKRGIAEGGAGTFNDYRGLSELGRLLLQRGDNEVVQSLLKPELLELESPDPDSLEAEPALSQSLAIEPLQSDQPDSKAPASARLATIPTHEEVAAKRSIWSRKVERMVIGDGLVLEPGAESEQRLILAWQADNCSSLVFVDEHGHESSKFYAEEIVAKLMAKRVAIVPRDDMPPFDHGVLAMIQKVYDDIATDAACDDVTGLYNRKKFKLLLEEAIRGVRRGGSNHVVCLMNLDKFKIVNASLGLAVGDELLRTVAERLKSLIDQDTVVASLGADEFALLLRNRSLSAASAQVHAMREALSQTAFRRDKESFNLSASWGLVEVNERCTNANTVLKTAYQACDVAKDGGCDQVHVYSESDSAIKHKNSVMEWTTRIARLLENNDFRLRLQKIAPLRPGNKHQHNEVLLSIVLDGETRPVPAEMIQAAEAYGLMQSIDRWVVETALGWMAENPVLLENMGGFAINLSGTSLNDELFLDFVLEEIVSSGVETSMLCFEVTETSTIENLDYTSSFIEEVKQLGCSFALDDFGTGMSSYAYLKTLPVDYLKIDGVFIRDIANSPTDYAMVKSINEIGHFLGMQTIAEFVENEQIAHVLSEIGVDYAQGYGIQKPYYMDELRSNLAQQETTQKLLRSG